VHSLNKSLKIRNRYKSKIRNENNSKTQTKPAMMGTRTTFVGFFYALFIGLVTGVENPEVSIINGQSASPGEAPYIIQIRFIDSNLHHCAGL
jgi:hypothetical protein